MRVRDMNLSQMRSQLFLARTLALEVQLAADQRWGARSASPVSTAAGRGVAQLDAAIAAVDELLAEERQR